MSANRDTGTFPLTRTALDLVDGASLYTGLSRAAVVEALIRIYAPFLTHDQAHKALLGVPGVRGRKSGGRRRKAYVKTGNPPGRPKMPPKPPPPKGKPGRPRKPVEETANAS